LRRSFIQVLEILQDLIEMAPVEHRAGCLDPRAGTLITNIPLGGKPEYGASADDGNASAPDSAL
jgi:hypothetical protein